MEAVQSPYALLCSRILEQAAEDYRELRKGNQESMYKKDEGTWSIKEIEDFLRSDWCNKTIIPMAGIECDGKTILYNIKNEIIH